MSVQDVFASIVHFNTALNTALLGHTLPVTVNYCRLGKRKVSERTDEASPDSRHVKRAAVNAFTSAKDVQTAVPPKSQPVGSLDAAIRGQDSDSRGQKRAAEAQHESVPEGTATDQGFRRPESKRPANRSYEQTGESKV